MTKKGPWFSVRIFNTYRLALWKVHFNQLVGTLLEVQTREIDN